MGWKANEVGGEGDRERLCLKRKAEEGLGGGDEGSREGDMVQWDLA